MHRDGPEKKSAKPRRSERRGSGPLGPARAPSDRPAQVAAEIRRALQTELSRGLNDPRVQGMVSITEVVLAPDFSVARVRISVIPPDRASLTLSGLRAGAGFLRRRVMDETRIARVPRIEFELDESIKRQAALDEAIRGPGAAAPTEGDGATPDAASAAGARNGRRAAETPPGEKHSENSRDEG